jgi:hypothetical protein
LINRVQAGEESARKADDSERNSKSYWRFFVNHKLSTFLLVFACFLGMNASLWGQNAAATHGIRGYLDPQTGAFHTIPHPELEEGAPPPALTTFTGKFVVTFTITVSSTIASTTKIGCQVEASLDDVTVGNFISESAANDVTRGTTSTVVCKATIPYSWALASASSDSISMSYTITSPVAVSTAAAEFPLRISTQSLPTIKVPVSGTTTSIAVSATI